ncbi:hypothetical protein ACFQ4Q_00550 [Lysobacter gummosus]|uniref:hypothetical protein n=1 Tax=Lysobacter gummosus TaxID=262324 RepID=UPI003645553B
MIDLRGIGTEIEASAVPDRGKNRMARRGHAPRRARWPPAAEVSSGRRNIFLPSIAAVRGGGRSLMRGHSRDRPRLAS